MGWSDLFIEIWRRIGKSDGAMALRVYTDAMSLPSHPPLTAGIYPDILIAASHHHLEKAEFSKRR